MRGADRVCMRLRVSLRQRYRDVWQSDLARFFVRMLFLECSGCLELVCHILRVSSRRPYCVEHTQNSLVQVHHYGNVRDSETVIWNERASFEQLDAEVDHRAYVCESNSVITDLNPSPRRVPPSPRAPIRRQLQPGESGEGIRCGRREGSPPVKTSIYGALLTGASPSPYWRSPYLHPEERAGIGAAGGRPVPEMFLIGLKTGFNALRDDAWDDAWAFIPEGIGLGLGYELYL